MDSVKRLRPNLEYCLSICLGRMNTEDLRQDCQYPIRDFNLGPTEYEVRMITFSDAVHHEKYQNGILFWFTELLYRCD
jgi:hypothetical protein